MQYVPPSHAAIGNGRPFDATHVERGFVTLRKVLNGTVGCYQRSGGRNIPNNRMSLGAASVQPGATAEVINTNIATTGPQSYTPAVPQSSASTPWDRYSTRFYPSGASVSFCAPSDATAFVSYDVCLNKSHSAFVAYQAGYTHHTIECRAKVNRREGGAGMVGLVDGTQSQRRIGMAAGTTDYGQAGSLSGNGSFSVVKGRFYSVWVQMDMILDMFPVAPSSRAVYMQMMSPGATMTVALLKV